jgi:hypothetical protein
MGVKVALPGVLGLVIVLGLVSYDLKYKITSLPPELLFFGTALLGLAFLFKKRNS